MTSEEAAIWTAVIVAIPTVLTAAVVPIVLRIIDMRAADRKDIRDIARQDEVARRALEAVKASKSVSESNTRLIQENTEVTRDMKAVVDKVKEQTNGMLSHVAATSHALGEIEGKIAGKLEQAAESGTVVKDSKS